MISACSASGMAISPFLLNQQSQAAPKQKRYLFVFAAVGGASIIDSFYAQTSGPNAFTADQLASRADTPFKAVKPMTNSIQGAIPLGNGYSQETFLSKYYKEMAIMTNEVSSVNHLIAAKRAVSGDNVNGGRTITEAVATDFGEGFIMPNVAMTGSGYARRGDDHAVADIARPQLVSDPLMLAFATHGFHGTGVPTNSKEMDLARKLRFQLEKISRFGKQFSTTPELKSYIANRERIAHSLEKGDLVTKLMLLDSNGANLGNYNMKSSPDLANLVAQFPDLATDPIESQTAMAFLLAKNGVSNALTIAPGVAPLIEAQGTPNAPIGFDWSHVDHRGGQNAMWSYSLKAMDSLITMLKKTDVDGDPSKGKMWDHSLIYVATEFGRDRVSGGGSGHHLNNGTLLISPLINGNKIYGGIDAATGLTYGFDPKTGEPGQNLRMKEKHIYSAVAHALGLDFPGRIDMPSMVKKA